MASEFLLTHVFSEWLRFVGPLEWPVIASGGRDHTGKMLLGTPLGGTPPPSAPGCHHSCSMEIEDPNVGAVGPGTLSSRPEAEARGLEHRLWRWVSLGQILAEDPFHR